MKKNILLIALTLAACTPVPVTPTTPPVVPSTGIISDFPNKAWNDLALKALTNHAAGIVGVVPKDVEEFCPNYVALDSTARRKFYIMLLSALAKFESNYKPTTTYTEKFPDAKGNRVVSAGIFQLSVESGNGYYCNLKKTADLFDPETNFNCAARIMNKWIVTDKIIGGFVDGRWRGMARYWSPFRSAERKKAMQARTKTLAICKK